MTLARIVSHVSFCISVIVCPLGFGRRSVCRTVVALPPSDGTHLPLKTPAKVPVSPLPVHVDSADRHLSEYCVYQDLPIH